MSARKGTERADPRLSIVFSYYDNPEMLKFQLSVFESFPRETWQLLEIVLVDDGSPLSPALECLHHSKVQNLKLFRIARDKPWNQDAARNIGAFEARGEYLLLTDIDHVVPLATVEALTSIDDLDSVFTLSRKAHFSEKVIPSHVNSYFLSRQKYWSIGGYDEDFWGTYGSDKLFRKRVIRAGGIKLLGDVRLELVTRGSISDAKNTGLPRTPSLLRKVRSVVLRGLKRMGLRENPVVMANPYVDLTSAIEK